MPSYRALLMMQILRVVRIFLDLFSNFLFRLIYFTNGPAIRPVRDELLLQPAICLARKIRRHEVTSVDVIKAFIKRIDEVQPILNLVTDRRFEAALEEAKRVDELIRSQQLSEEKLEKRFPFLGIPFTVKESIGVKGLLQTNALLSFKHNRAGVDADVVKLMRKAGGIPLAVTNVPEFCMWVECNNNVYGKSSNPYNTSRAVGGSSGGEGAILGSGGSVIGIGSDLAGSIRIPAFFNGVFGHKPTSCIVSSNGPVLSCDRQYGEMEVVGPMCRYASDLLPMLKVMAGENACKLNLDQKVDVSKLKIYYMEDDRGNPLCSPVNSEIKSALRKVLKYFEETYGIQATKADFINMRHSLTMWAQKIATDEESPFMASLMATRKGEINLKLELLKWAFGLSNFTLPCISYGIYEKMFRNRDLMERKKYVAKAIEMRSQFEEMLGDNGIFLYPPHPTVAFYHGQSVFKNSNIAYTAVFNTLGFPVTQCPLGLNSEGLPLGVQVVAGRKKDHLTLAVAIELEKTFGGWRNPHDI